MAESFALSIENGLKFGDLGLDDIAEDLKNKNNALNVYVLANDGKYMVHNDYTRVGKKHIREEMISDRYRGVNFYLYRDVKKNKLVYNFYYPVRKNEDIIGIANVELDYNEINSKIRQTVFGFIVIFILALVIGISGSMLLGKVVAKPINVLTDGVKIVAGGNLDFRIDLKSNDEIELLKSEFNIMTGKLKQAQEIKLKQQRIEQELRIASEIQKVLIPKEIPELKLFNLSTYYKSAREVGGDYYDLMKIDDDRLAIMIADVTGKGVPAALVMTMTKSLFRTSVGSSRSVKDTMLKINDALYKDTKPNMFVTANYAILNEKKKYIEFLSAGHEPLLFYSNRLKKFEDVECKGIPLGLMDNNEFDKEGKQTKIKVEKGDIVLLYTDGLTDSQDKNGNLFGLENVKSCILKHSAKNASEIIEQLKRELINFSGTETQKDDITIILIK